MEIGVDDGVEREVVALVDVDDVLASGTGACARAEPQIKVQC